MKFFKVLSVDTVKEKLKEVFADFKLNTESVNIIDALDRVLAQDIISNIDVPEFNRSTMDGYAINSFDSHGASESVPIFLDVIGEVSMGKSTDLIIESGMAAYVPTGGMIPKGSDSVMMIEYTEKLDENSIMIHKPISKRENIMLIGDDIQRGQIVLEKGKKINPQDIGSLAALGMNSIIVYKKPTFTIISTGDEIIDINEKQSIGKIRDINGYVLQALITKTGGEVAKKIIVKDDFELLKEEVNKAVDKSDIVLIIGGSSVGTRDFTHDVIDSIEGTGVFVHGISIKPGKPTIIGEGKGKIIFGLPGHPVSSIIIFKVFVEFILEELMKIRITRRKTKAILDCNIHSAAGKETYQMVTLDKRDDKLYALPKFGKSGMITLLVNSCGYIIIESHKEGLNKGQEIDVYYI